MSKKTSVSMNDVARHAGVSNASVSRYVNNNNSVSEKTKIKIERSIQKLGYKQNMIARFLKMKKTNQIMLVVPDIENPFYSSVYKNIQEKAEKEGLFTLLYNSFDKLEKELDAIDIASSLNCDGLIFCSTYDRKEVINKLKKQSFAIVTSNTFDEDVFDTVHSKKGESTYISTRHLIDYGHKKIAFCGGKKDSIIEIRRKGGYLRALNEFSVQTFEKFIYEDDYTSEAGNRAALYLLSLDMTPTGVVCANDLIAIGVAQSLMDAGIKVPEEISVTGVDDIYFTKMMKPSITTVSNNPIEFATYAFELLSSRINGLYKGKARETFVSRKLIVRESTRRI